LKYAIVVRTSETKRKDLALPNLAIAILLRGDEVIRCISVQSVSKALTRSTRERPPFTSVLTL